MARVAVVQVNQCADVDSNLRKVADFAAVSRAKGAAVVCLPENCVYFGPDAVSMAESVQGPTMQRLQRIAQTQSLWVSVGGFPERCDHDPKKYYNSHVLLNDSGEVVSVYRKLHLFDVSISPTSTYLESDKVAAGDCIQPPVPTPIGSVGLSICYDLRFPEIYRRLTMLGAEVLLVPSAFLEKTGYAHWEPLLRARAIENQCYVVAAAQEGRFSETRVSYGHSCVIDPWGNVVGMCSEGERVLVADIDLSYLREVRSKLPCLRHRRSDVYG